MLRRQGPVTSTSNNEDSAPSIAVVICTHNRPAILERCLQRLQQIDNLDFSVLVVDSAPNSSEAKTVAARYGAEYNVSPLKGLSRARNIGSRATHADIIAYLDDDMVPHTHWLDSLIAEFACKDVMAVTGPVLTLELADASDVDLRLAVELAPWGPHSFQIDQSSHQWFERTNFGGIGDGNFALRRSGFDQIQGFDEQLGRGATIDIGEEHYAYFRLVDRGFKIAYSPHAVVFHPTAPMSRDYLRKQTADTVAFAAFVAWNNPRRLWRLAIFLTEGSFRARRWWRGSTTYQVISLPTRDRMASAIDGLSIFLRSVRQTSAIFRRDFNGNSWPHNESLNCVERFRNRPNERDR
jgi:GT2 family glycosyltransferase